MAPFCIMMAVNGVLWLVVPPLISTTFGGIRPTISLLWELWAPFCIIDGKSWSSTICTGTADDLHGFWESSASNAYAVGANGAMVHYNGSHWDDSWVVSMHFYGIWGNSAGNIFVVGANGTILHYDGIHWRDSTSGTSNHLYGIWGSSANNVYAVGANGTILHYDGKSWISMVSGTTISLSRI